MNEPRTRRKLARHGTRGVLLLLVAVIGAACGDAFGPPTSPGFPETEAHDDPVDPGEYRPSDGPARLYISAVDGSSVRRVATGSWPAWSPDGRRISFHDASGIHVVDADGSNQAWIRRGSFPSWSPDGERIAFTDADGISVMDIDGSGVTNLLRHGFRDDTYAPWDMGVGKPSWSPDGERIAFEHLGDGDIQPAQIYVMDADGSELRQPTNTGAIRFAESDPSWSPDGSRIVFWSFGFGIASVQASGGPPRSIYSSFPSVAYGARPAWSPDGRAVAFTANRFSPGGPAIWVVDTEEGAGSARVLLGAGQDPAFSPDGASIAFAVDDSCPTVTELLLWRTEGLVDDGFYRGQNFVVQVVVGAGTGVEWVNANQVFPHTMRIVSTSEPPGGHSFDSGILQPQAEDFRFVPNVPGTWEYMDAISGTTSKIIARPPGRGCGR